MTISNNSEKSSGDNDVLLSPMSGWVALFISSAFTPGLSNVF